MGGEKKCESDLFPFIALELIHQAKQSVITVRQALTLRMAIENRK